MQFKDICPVVDIEKNPEGIYDALAKRGYCWVLNSGFTDAEVLHIYEKSKDFWGLPREKKLAYKQGSNITFSGYVPWGIHRPSSATPKHLLADKMFDYKEAYDFLHKDHDLSIIPNEPESAEFFDYANELLIRCSLFGKRVIDIVSDGLNARGLDGERGRRCFKLLGNKDNMSYMRIARYPPNKDREQAKEVEFDKTVNRMGIHRDSSPYVTLIMSPDIRGLDVEDPEYGWFPVDNLGLKNAIWVQVGQLGYHLADGKIQQPPLHKVSLPEDPNMPERFSIVHFCTADKDAIIEPMSSNPDWIPQSGLEWVCKALVKGYSNPSEQEVIKKDEKLLEMTAQLMNETKPARKRDISLI